MGIKLIGNHRFAFNQAVNTALAQVDNDILSRLAYIGEKCLEIARNAGDYTDRTGNLRSSIGYVIVKDGKIWETGGFDANNNSGEDGEEGAEEGMSVAVSKAETYQSGYALVVVAGMEYAGYVEKRDYDVLTFTETEARQIADSIFKQIAKRV